MICLRGEHVLQDDVFMEDIHILLRGYVLLEDILQENMYVL